MTPRDQWNWEEIRVFLKMRAELLRLDPKLQVRFDESDLVQETIVRAMNPTSEPFRGQTRGEQFAWLLKLLNSTYLDLWRKHHADIRDVDQEQQLRKHLDDSTGVWIETPIAGGTQPPDIAERNEQMLQASIAIQELSTHHREVWLARAVHQMKFADIAEKQGTPLSTIARWYREATEALAQKLSISGDPS